MRRAMLGGLILLMAAPLGALAQYPPNLPPPPGAVGPPTFGQEELAQLLAPIALYPDPLLAQILMAATYPVEVVQADRWVKAYPSVQGPQLEEAMQQQPWDPSVKSLTAFPQVLAMMDEHLDWTQRLGDAFLAQEQDVMATVQMLRARAYAAGYLQSTPQQTITVQPQVIVVEPMSPQVVYVPVYDPTVVYGPWWYPAYPPYYWYPPGYAFRARPFSFAFSVAVGTALWGGFDWHRHNVTIVNVNHYNAFNRTHIVNTNVTWQHDPAHRGGVPYHDRGVRQRFGQGPRPGVAAREPFRGRAPEAPQSPRQGSFDRRSGSGASSRADGAPRGGFQGRQPLESSPPPAARHGPGGGSSPDVGRAPQSRPERRPPPEVPRPPEAQRPGGAPPQVSRTPEGGPGRQRPSEVPRQPTPQQPGGSSAPQVGPGLRGGPGPRPTFEAPHQPSALEGLGHGGETRSTSDRGRMSRGGTSAPAGPGPAPSPPRSPQSVGPARPAPTAPAPAPAPGGGPPRGGGGERKGQPGQPSRERGHRPATGVN